MATFIQLKRIDNYGHMYYLIDITIKPTFGLASSCGPSRDPKLAAWYMSNFCVQIKEDRNDDYPRLHEYQHSPTNEIGSVELTSTSGFNLSAGPTLNPVPPFASLSSTVGYSESTTQTTKAENFNCTYIQKIADDGVPVMEWQVELAHYLEERGILVGTVKPAKFYWVDSRGHSVGSIPKDAMNIVEKTFTQSYIFEAIGGDELKQLTYDFDISGCCTAQFSGHSGGPLDVKIDEVTLRNSAELLQAYKGKKGSNAYNLKPPLRTDAQGNIVDVNLNPNNLNRISAVQNRKVRIEILPANMALKISDISPQ